MDIGSFNWKEMFNNNDGKTSASAVAGLYLTTIGGICFLITLICWMFKIVDSLLVMNNVLLLVSLGTALLGVRKIFKDKNTTEVDKNEEKG